MKVRHRNAMLSITGLNFDPQLSLIDSAQSFLWREHEGRYYTVLNGSGLCLESVQDGFVLHPVNEAEVEDYLHYFDLARDYEGLVGRYAEFPPVAEALAKLPGLRVLNQPTWEVLVTFILSANNNVERIRKLTWLLCEHFGEPVAADGLQLRSMPGPAALAAVPEAALRALGFGYRAPFLVETAKRVRDGFDLGALSELPYEEAHERLVTLSGVGDKVADCVLLFGCGHASAFPVDVWVARLMEAWFPAVRGLSKLKLQRASRAMLGDEAGIVQQFMFHCARCGIMGLGM